MASVVGLRRDLLDAILVGGQVPVVAPLARDADGIVCNVNADDAAAGIAAGLGARQLVLLTDVDGVRDADGRRLDALTAGEAETLIESGRHRRRDGAQGPGRARRARLGRRRGDHRGLVRAGGARAGPHRPDVRHADHGGAGRPRGRGMNTNGNVNGQTGHDHKQQRQRAIRDLIASRPVGSQREVVDALSAQGFEVTQATVSRDITELGLVKAPGADGHVYLTPELAGTAAVAGGAGKTTGSDDRLIRILADIPVTIGRSGLILVLTGTPGTASVIAQAIDESTLHEQEGTLAGDNTLLVLFADEARLGRWLDRFQLIQARSGGSRIP